MSDEDKATSSELLTTEGREACQRIAAQDEGVWSQRAAALLAIDEGMTRAQASAKTGLTPGQVSYAVSLLRHQSLAMFPNAPSGETPPPETEPEKKASQKGKDRDAGRGKDKKKGKGKGKDKKKGKGKGKDKKKAKSKAGKKKK